MGWKAGIASVAFGLFALTTPVSSQPTTVTVDQVLANPTKYEGRQVRVHGFATFEFENNRLWRDEVAFRNYEPHRALYLVSGSVRPPNRDDVKGRLVYATGTFTTGNYRRPWLKDVTSVQRDPTDHGPDRGWWSDPQFGTIFTLLGVLGVIGVWLALAFRAQTLLHQPDWTARKRRV